MTTYKVRENEWEAGGHSGNGQRLKLRFFRPQPFGWEILELRYGGIRARLETMHERIASYLDEEDSSVTSLPELEVDLEVR